MFIPAQHPKADLMLQISSEVPCYPLAFLSCLSLLKILPPLQPGLQNYASPFIPKPNSPSRRAEEKAVKGCTEGKRQERIQQLEKLPKAGGSQPNDSHRHQTECILEKSMQVPLQSHAVLQNQRHKILFGSLEEPNHSRCRPQHPEVLGPGFCGVSQTCTAISCLSHPWWVLVHQKSWLSSCCVLLAEITKYLYSLIAACHCSIHSASMSYSGCQFCK